jgi:hypothetical protein
MNISPEYFSCRFTVQSAHGEQIEFVLSATEDRNDLNRGHYSGILHDMLDEAFADTTHTMITDSEIYGHLAYTVEAASPEELRYALNTCETVVGKWLRKYNINKMKRNA